MSHENKRPNFFSVIFESILAWTCIVSFMTSWMNGGNRVFAGFSLMFGAVLAMNSLARIDLLVHFMPKIVKDHPWTQFFKHITGEGEFAGIMVGFLTLVALVATGESIHIPYAEAFTLYGIMSAANLAVQDIIPIMATIERIGGPWAVVAVGSVLSSITGEPAAAVFLTEYLKKRVREEDKPILASGLGATIGSGGGLLPLAAPPILIVWGVLSTTFGWTYADLFKLVGVACLMHVGVTALYVKRLMKPQNSKLVPFRAKGLWSLALLLGLVGAHIAHMTFPGIILYAFDLGVGVGVTQIAFRRYRNCSEEMREEAFRMKWQPLTLAVLLIALEFIGVGAGPAINWIADTVLPKDIPLLGLGVVLFFITAWTSHVADNALASRMYINIPVAMMAGGAVSATAGSFLAACIVMGALYGGFLLIPANLPNFPIARILGVTPGQWARVAWRLNWSIVAYLVWIFYLSTRV